MMIAGMLLAATACGTGTVGDPLETVDGGNPCEGQPDGVRCGDTADLECDNPDICLGGVCTPAYEPAGILCGDPTDNECTNPDTCDGAGNCVGNHEPQGTACGDPDPSDPECDNPDICDGAGACIANAAPAGTPCGDDTNTDCASPDTCDGTGACLSNDQIDGAACTDCTTGACQGCTGAVCLNACADAPTTLTTQFAANTGQAGNMFDVRSLNSEIRVEGFDVNLNAGTHTIEIYYKEGSYVGFDTDPDAWTLAATVSDVTSTALDTPTTVPATFDIRIPPGLTMAFYVTATAVSMGYSTGTAAGVPFVSDGNIEILEGAGKEYPFGATFEPRVFNGNIRYSTCP